LKPTFFTFIKVALIFFALCGLVVPWPGSVPLEDGTQLYVETGLPKRITIKSIDVDAAIVTVGLTETGAMAAPEFPMDAAWYQYGPRPGDTGSTVIAGHVNWYGGESAIFSRLDELVVGDEIIIQLDTGKELTFAVKELRQYPQDADPTEVFKSVDGLSRLNLVTCDGVWNAELGTHTMRLVVFAVKV
jgi:sortase A